MAGMRGSGRNDQVGQVQIWDRNAEGVPDTEQLMAYQEAAVTEVVMVTDAIGVSGGVDGALRCWDVRGPNSKPTTIPAHDGPVLALERLSSQIIMSIGQDGRGRVWDLDRLECVQEFLDPGSGSIGGLLSLERVPRSQGVVGVYPSGTVVAHNLDPADTTTYQVPVAGAGASALTLAGSHLVIAEKQGQQIRSVPLAEAVPSNPQSAPGALKGETVPTRKPVLALEAVSVDRVVAAFKGERVVLWHLAPTPTRSRELEVHDARSVAGPPRREQFARGAARRREKREELLDRVRGQLDSGRLSSLKPDLVALSEEGMDVEALILLAEWARRNERPLWELRVRLHLTEHLPEKPWCAVHYHALGQLLEQLQEPAHAQRYFEQADRCQSGFRNARDRVRQLPARTKPPEESLVDDFFEDPEQAVFEAEKHAVLGEPWAFLVTLERTVEKGGDLSAEQVMDHLPKSEQWRVRERTVASNGRAESLQMLERSLPSAGERFVFGISFGEKHGERVVRVWVDPTDREPLSEDAKSSSYAERASAPQAGERGADPHRPAANGSSLIEGHLEKMNTSEFRETKERARKEFDQALERIESKSQRDRNVL